MKHILRLTLIMLLLVACKDEKKEESKTVEGYLVEGSAPGVYNGMRVYLKSADPRKREAIKDTAIVMNEKFTLSGPLDAPEMQMITVDGVPGQLSILLENQKINIEVDKTNLANSKITGSKSNEAAKAYTDKMLEYNNQQRQISTEMGRARQQSDTEKMNSLQAQNMALNEEAKAYPFKFIDEHPDNYFSLSILESQLQDPNIDVDKAESAFNNLDNDIKTSDYGKRVNGALTAVKAERERTANLDIGRVAPEFSGPNPEGKEIALADIKGKATIIDFWASWCGPCRRENPNVVKVYNKYKNKGLEIVSVSLDRPGQKDRWLKAIEDDKLDWHHISNLQHFSDPIAMMYNIRSIPATYILDEDGKIVAKSLRGQALEDQIAKMLN